MMEMPLSFGILARVADFSPLSNSFHLIIWVFKSPEVCLCQPTSSTLTQVEPGLPSDVCGCVYVWELDWSGWCMF